jgi:adenylylsulfate kinase
LYGKARAGQIREFTGIDSPYEPPVSPQLAIDTSKVSIEAAVAQILRYLDTKGFLHQQDPGL